MTCRSTSGSVFDISAPVPSVTESTMYGFIRYPPLQQALTAVMSWSGVMLNVWPNDAAASCEKFSLLQKTLRGHQMLPLSPGSEMPVFPVREASGFSLARKKPKLSQ